jgi:hypothetical protein
MLSTQALWTYKLHFYNINYIGTPVLLINKTNKNMVHSTVKDVIASSPHPILPTVQGEPDYPTINSIRKLLCANALSIESQLVGVILVPIRDGGTAAALLVRRHCWEEAVSIFTTWTTVEQSLKNKLTRHLSQRTLNFLTMTLLNYSHSRIPPSAPARPHGQIQAPREPPN